MCVAERLETQGFIEGGSAQPIYFLIEDFLSKNFFFLAFLFSGSRDKKNKN